MWKVKSLNVYRQDLAYLAYIQCTDGVITRVRLEISNIY